MGNNNANQIKKLYNEEKDIKLDITLNKVCYLPGEQISGTLDIQSNVGYNETILNDTNVNMKIIQFHCARYSEEDTTINEKGESDILTENIDFINFKGANIMSGINIPFSIKIPINIHASIINGKNFYKDYVKYFFLLIFLELKLKEHL